jgi:hypothetical protein
MKTRLLILLLVFCNSTLLLAQTEPEDIKLEVNKFQDYFFEALKQKGLRTTIKRLSLEQCLKN